jgi:hypothetical protein
MGVVPFLASAMLIATLSADPALAFGRSGPSQTWSQSCQESNSLRCAVVLFLAKLHTRKDRPHEHNPPPPNGCGSNCTTVPEIDAASGLAALGALGAALALVYDRRRRSA